jgi:glyoxylase-like metal-dependent hydrolase (beta-lactamase superfamily II)
MMNRQTILGMLIGVSGLTLTVAAQLPPPNAPKVIESEKVKDNLYVLRGGGGNSAVFITGNGVVVVDTKLAGWGQPLIEKIKTITDKPITTIINTHSHGDHVSGNVEFPATVDIVTHENTKAEMEAWRPVTGITNIFPNVFKDNPGKGMPKRTYRDKMTIGTGNDKIDLYYFGPGHTGGDSWVVFPALRTVHTGDMFANKNIPLIDSNNGGKALGYAQTLAKAVAGIQNVDLVICGHAPAMMMFSDLKEYADFNKDFATWVETQMKAGKTVDQASAEYMYPDRYKGYTALNPARVKTNVQIYYDELKKGTGTK